jgi:excisionase family DNA binding protein
VSEPPDDLIVAFQAAKLLGVGHQRMYAMVRSGQIPAQRRSGRWWVRRSDLEAALERARLKPGQLSRTPCRRGRATRGRRSPPLTARAGPLEARTRGNDTKGLGLDASIGRSDQF